MSISLPPLRIFLATVLAWIAAGLAEGKPRNLGEGPLRVAVSFPVLYSWVANIGGPHVCVELASPLGTDPHHFLPDRRRLAQLLWRNSLFICQGLGLEKFLDPLAKEKNKRAILLAAEHLSPRSVNGRLDPHAWLDPLLAARMVERIVEACMREDPAHAWDYQERGHRYLGRLLELDGQYRASVGRLMCRVLVTQHPAFGYLADRYGMEVLGALEDGEGNPLGPQELQVLKEKMRSRGVHVFFATPGHPAESVRRFVASTGATVAFLDPMEIGPCSAGFYEDVARRNLKALVCALGQEAPVSTAASGSPAGVP